MPRTFCFDMKLCSERKQLQHFQDGNIGTPYLILDWSQFHLGTICTSHASTMASYVKSTPHSRVVRTLAGFNCTLHCNWSSYFKFWNVKL